MRQCPKCKRTYYDETLNYCLDDGTELLYRPAADKTAILPTDAPRLIAGDEVRTRVFEAKPEGPTRLMPNAAGRNSVRMVALLLLIAIFAICGYWFYGRASSKQINSIAVMPFVNESGNTEVDYLSDGMTESLIGSLAQLPNLNVKARTSVFRYKGKEIDPRQIGSELNVQAILTGRVVQRGNNIALYVELIDAATENVLWKADYSRAMADLVTLQKEIAQDASLKLRSKLSEADAQSLTKKGDTSNPEAYRLYLQGRFYWNKRRITDMGKAIGFFEQAIALDPNYALAWAGYADAVAQPSDVVPHLDRRDKALAAVRKALSINPDLSEAHTSVAHILMRYDLNFVESELELKRAFELDPKWVDTYQRYGEWYIAQGRLDEGIGWLRRGLDIEPFNLPLNTAYGAALISAGRYDEAIVQLKKAADLDPSHRNAFVALAFAYGAKAMYAEAMEARVTSLKLAGQDEWAESIRERFEKKGWDGMLRAELERFSKVGYSADRLPHYNRAAVLAQLGETDQAFAALDESLRQREQPALSLIKVDVRFIQVRNDPRFNELLRRVGLPAN